MISYYDLLGMVKEGNAPERISVSLTYGTSRIYKAEYDADDFTMYFIDDRNEADEDYKLYLSECFLESSMFDKRITILDEEEFEDIEELGNNFTYKDNNSEIPVKEWEKSVISNKINQLIKNQKKIISKLGGKND